MKSKAIIYLVDDDDDDRMFTREAFESVLQGVSLIEFSDGQLLLHALEDTENTVLPSFIVMDINMPYINGLEALSVIRSNENLCHIPIVLFSTSSSQEMIRKAYRMGVNAYMVKPASLSGYIQMATAVCLCFLHQYRLSTKPALEISSKRKSILVIEDNFDHWNLMQLALQSKGDTDLIHVDSAESTLAFLAAEQAAARRPVEMIVLDLYLPGRQQGLDLIGQIRSFFAGHGLPPVPILIFSGSDHDDDIYASYQRQVNAYLLKSCDLARSALLLKDVCSLWNTTIAVPGMF